MDQISWIWRISRMLHRIWCFPNNDENPDEVKNGRKVNCPSDILVKRWLSLRFLPRHIPPQSKYSPIAKRVYLRKENHMTRPWEYKGSENFEKCSLDAQRHADYWWMPYTFLPCHNRPRIPCFQAGPMTTLSVNWVQYYITSPTVSAS